MQMNTSIPNIPWYFFIWTPLHNSCHLSVAYDPVKTRLWDFEAEAKGANNSNAKKNLYVTLKI